MAVDLFLQIDGVTGESADANHAGHIDIVSLGWGASQAASISGGGAGAGKVSFGDLSIIADMDKATPTLLKFCASGKHIANIKVSMCKAGEKQMEYATIVLNDVLVTNVQFGHSNTVIYSFQGAKVEHHYWTQSKDGGKGAEIQMGWDIKGNIATA